MRYILLLSSIIAICLFNTFLIVNNSAPRKETVTITVEPVAKPLPKVEEIKKENIHAQDCVRIKQYHEIYYFLTDEYSVNTELWVTYKNQLNNEARESCIVHKDKIDSAKRAQFNEVYPRYQKLLAKVKNRL